MSNFATEKQQWVSKTNALTAFDKKRGWILHDPRTNYVNIEPAEGRRLLGFWIDDVMRW
jgi:hypothetical protein